MSTSRRNLLLAGLGFSAFVALQFYSGKSKQLYTSAEYIQKLELSDEEWQRKLSPDAYQVLRKRKTEIRTSSPLNREWRTGIYCCRGCDSRAVYLAHEVRKQYWLA